MNKETFKANWTQLKERLKDHFPSLTEDDLKYVEGKEDELYGRLQQRLGKNRAQLDKVMEQRLGKNRAQLDKVMEQMHEKFQEKAKKMKTKH